MLSCSSNRLRKALVGLSLSFLAAQASASVVTLAPAADTFITIHPTLGGPSSNHGSDSFLAVIGVSGASSVYTASMVRFDLSAYAGQTIQGPVTLSMYVQGTSFPANVPDRDIVVNDIVGSWNESTVNANNASFVPGAVLDSQSIHYLSPADDRWVSWTLPAVYVQNWIDAPLTNGGVYFQNVVGGPLNDLQFGSRESAHPPELTFTVVPAPSCAGIFGLAAVGMMRRRRA